MSSTDVTALAYSIPAFYTNNIAITQINGLFRLTFFEQNAVYSPGGAPPNIITSPRVAVMVTASTAVELAEVLLRILHVPDGAMRQ